MSEADERVDVLADGFYLRDKNGKLRAQMFCSEDGSVSLQLLDGENVIDLSLHGDLATLTLRARGNSGNLILDKDSASMILTAGDKRVGLMAGEGTASLLLASGDERLPLSADDGSFVSLDTLLEVCTNTSAAHQTLKELLDRKGIITAEEFDKEHTRQLALSDQETEQMKDNAYNEMVIELATKLKGIEKGSAEYKILWGQLREALRLLGRPLPADEESQE